MKNNKLTSTKQEKKYFLPDDSLIKKYGLESEEASKKGLDQLPDEFFVEVLTHFPENIRYPIKMALFLAYSAVESDKITGTKKYSAEFVDWLHKYLLKTIIDEILEHEEPKKNVKNKKDRLDDYFQTPVEY